MKKRVFFKLFLIMGILLILPFGVKAEKIATEQSEVQMSIQKIRSVNYIPYVGEYHGYFYKNDVKANEIPNDLKLLL